MRIGFLTSTTFRDLYDDDRLAADELRRRGHEVVPVIWTEVTAADLDALDVLVVRSPWDWFHHRDRFRAFLASLRRVRARVVNAPETMLAFADKTYLPRLAAQGIDVIPTVQLTRAELDRVPALLDERAWATAVLKPAFTANAVGAQCFERADAARVVAESKVIADAEPWLLQPFVPSIRSGERSFVFFGGRFSHALTKVPRAGDWRVQHDYGGQSAPSTATAQEIAEATALLERSAPGTVYGRVDAVEWQGRLHLMELEVVEPELFFRHEPEAARRFADALLG